MIGWPGKLSVEAKERPLSPKRPGAKGVAKLWKPNNGPLSLHRTDTASEQDQKVAQSFRLLQRPATTTTDWDSELQAQNDRRKSQTVPAAGQVEEAVKPRNLHQPGLAWLDNYMSRSSSSSQDSETKNPEGVRPDVIANEVLEPQVK